MCAPNPVISVISVISVSVMTVTCNILDAHRQSGDFGEPG